MGALLSYLQEFVFNLDSIISVNDVQSFVLETYLRIDQNSYQSLQIFNEDSHPNVLKGPGRSKEGFSIFGLMDRTKSLPGRRRLK
jgi:DNA mismatch repair protein MSH5